jgi:hypothetical protein
MTPSLTVSGNGDSATWTFGANACRGEDPNGTWTMTLMEKDFIFGEVIGETAIA